MALITVVIRPIQAVPPLVTAVTAHQEAHSPKCHGHDEHPVTKPIIQPRRLAIHYIVTSFLYAISLFL